MQQQGPREGLGRLPELLLLGLMDGEMSPGGKANVTLEG